MEFTTQPASIRLFMFDDVTAQRQSITLYFDTNEIRIAFKEYDKVWCECDVTTNKTVRQSSYISVGNREALLDSVCECDYNTIIDFLRTVFNISIIVGDGDE